MTSWIKQQIQRQSKLEGKIRLSFILVLLSIAVVMVFTLVFGIIVHYRMLTDALRDSTMKRYEDEVRHIVETMTTTIEAIVPFEIGPDMDKNDRDHVINLIHEAQYGHPNGYFFMFDMDGNVIAQRIHRGHEGMNRFHEKDKGGKLYVQELIEAARRGGDFVEYMMEKPGQEGKGNFPKIAYAKMLRGNRWWVGSGVYVDTIDTDIHAQNKKVLFQVGFVMILSGGFLVGLLWIAFRLSAMLGQQITRPIAQLVDGAKTLSEGNYGYRVSVNTQDELKLLADKFNDMGETIGHTILNEKTAREESEKYLEQLRAATVKERTLVEAERKRIAHGLHDDIGQKLLTLRKDVENAQITVEDESHQALLDRMIQSIININDGIREIMQNLRPRVLDDLGLLPALRVHLEKQAESAKLVLGYYDRVGELSLLPEVEINVFRIFQQAMANVVQHAHACRVDVWIRCKGKMLEVCMQDDGRGFDVDASMRRPGDRKHFGIINMKERCKSFGGTVELVSDPRVGGTRVEVSIPLAPSA